MTEMLAALLGAVVGGALSAWVGARQTAKVLKHETDLAATERREAQRVDENRRRTFAADQLIAALADCTTVKQDEGNLSAAFARMSATADGHHERNERAEALLRAGSSHAHALPKELHERWDALTWMVRFNQSKQPERSDDMRHRDASDLLGYIECMRQSLRAVSGDYPAPPHHPAPDIRREERRVWGFKPEEGCDEPDLTDWHLSDRLIGEVKLSSREVQWRGPNGVVKGVPNEATEALEPDV